MPSLVDQTGYEVAYTSEPKRIVSLVPSQTELLFELGLAERIAGITRFCIYPEDKVGATPKVGGTKKLDHDRIDELQPDLILANKEENTRDDIELLRSKCPVWTSDVATLQDALDMIEAVGTLTGVGVEELTNEITTGFEGLATSAGSSVAYLIWQNPHMAAGQGTFIDDMLGKAGYTNIFDVERYPVTSIEELVEKSPDVLMLSSEPFPFNETHAEELQSKLPNTQVVLVDGTMFSWYGSRLRRVPEYFSSLRV